MRVSLIADVLKEKDAISSSTRSKALALKQMARSGDIDLDLRVFVTASDYDLGDSVKNVSSTVELMYDRHFLASDLIIYDFGIYYELFNSIHLAPEAAKVMVHYHNITPADYVASYNREYIEMSFVQLVNILKADTAISSSRYNDENLMSYGVDEKKIVYLNYVIDSAGASGAVGVNPDHLPGKAGLDEKEWAGTVDAVYVGRFVPAKGLKDLLEALRHAIDNGAGNIHLTLMGSRDLSDPGYFQELGDQIKSLGLAGHVSIVDGPTDEERDAHYRRAHLFLTASYHEGFCVPVIEALKHGCYVISYDSGNLAYVANGLGSTVKTGDVREFSEKIIEYVKKKSAGKPPEETSLTTDSGAMTEAEMRHRAYQYSLEFSGEKFSERFFQILKQAGLVDHSPVGSSIS